LAYLLQLCGLSDPLQLFYLEQGLALPPASAGPLFAGFRTFQLDDLLSWALEAAARRCWEAEAIQRAVMDAWFERAEAIRQWQQRLQQDPSGRLMVAGLGSQRDWEQRCEAMLRA
jgi:hypothetical protein